MGFIRELIRSPLQLTIVLGLLTAVFLLAGALPQMPNTLASLLTNTGFALLVAIFVRWVDQLFMVSQPTVHSYSSSEAEYRKAIEEAQYRIWIHNSWLKATDEDAGRILATQAKEKSGDVRLLLASFRPNSFVFVRIVGRPLTVADAKGLVATTVRPYLKSGAFSPEGLHEHLRFTFGHHPGWIAVLDSRVFWGPTPIDENNQGKDIYFNVAPLTDTLGQFWIGQFDKLWRDYSHDYNEERKYNTQLPELPP